MNRAMELEPLELIAIRTDGNGIIYDSPVTFTPAGRGLDITICGTANAHHLHTGDVTDLIHYLVRFLAEQESGNWALLPTKAREERVRPGRALPGAKGSASPHPTANPTANP